MSIGGIDQIDGLQTILRDLESSGPEMATAGTQALFAAVQRDVAAGKDPNTGAAFVPTLDGGKPLKNAPGALSWRIVGNGGLLGGLREPRPDLVGEKLFGSLDHRIFQRI
jgi:hypothetical protein